MSTLFSFTVFDKRDASLNFDYIKRRFSSAVHEVFLISLISSFATCRTTGTSILKDYVHSS